MTVLITPQHENDGLGTVCRSGNVGLNGGHGGGLQGCMLELLRLMQTVDQDGVAAGLQGTRNIMGAWIPSYVKGNGMLTMQRIRP